MKGQKISLGFLFGFAIKNLGRYKKRTLITASAIAFGLMMFIFIDSWLYGADVESQRNFVELETGAVIIVDDQYVDEKDFLPLDYTIKNPEGIITKLNNAGYAATPRIPFEADMIIYENPFPADGSKRVKVTAIDPATVKSVFRLDGMLVEGDFIEPGKPEIIIGSWLAEDIGAEVGHSLIFETDTKPVVEGGLGVKQTIDVTIAGIIKTENPQINRYAIYFPIDLAQQSLLMKNEVVQISVAVPFYDDMDFHAANIEKILSEDLSGKEVVNWETWAADFLAISAAKRQGSGTILGLVFLIAVIGIVNTMLMALFERRKEIGMMRAIGFQDRDIFWSFIFEAGGIGILGSIAGMIMGFFINLYMVEVGVDFSFLLRDMDIGYRLSGVMRAMWSPMTFLVAGVSGFLMSVIIAIWPTMKANKISITECLRTE